MKGILFIVFIFTLSFSYSQEKIQFTNYTINAGLSQSVVQCMVQDNFGAIWLGTQDGLNRFDGMNFNVFTSGKTRGIDNEYIMSANKDSKGNLYFGTLNGLIQYDPLLETFTTFHTKNGKKAEIKSILTGSDNKIWVGTTDGRLLYLNTNNELENLTSISCQSSIVSLIKHGTNNMLIFTEEGEVIEYEKDKNNFKKNQIPNFNNLRVNKVVPNNSDEYLICTTKGILNYNKEKATYSSYDLDLSSYDISDVFNDNNQQFILTKTNGLIVKKSNEVLKRYTADFFQKTALIDNNLNFIQKDKNNLIWIGSQRGISTFNPEHNGFQSITVSSQANNGLIYQNVWSFSQTETQNILIGNDNGVSLYSEKTNEFYHFKKNINLNSDQKFNVLSILKLDKNSAYIGTFEGLYKLNFDTTDYSNFDYISLKSKSSPTGFNQIYLLLRYDETRLLLATKGGVAIYDETTKKYSYLIHKKNDASTLGAGSCRLLFKSKTGAYFVAPSGGGLYEIIEKNNKFIVKKPSFYRVLREYGDDFLTSVYQPNKNEYWFGTLGGGLLYLNQKENKIEQFDRKSGIPNEVIYSIHAFRDSILFMSSNRGIIEFNTQSKKFVSYREQDGLISDEFNMNASLKDSRGTLYFGGIHGYNFFNPEELKMLNPNLNVRFSEIWMENELIKPSPKDIIEKSISQTKKIELPYRHRTILLKFFTDNYVNPKQLNYKYKLVGDDEVEEYLGNTNELRFTSLSPGEYTLFVYAQLGQKDWSKVPAQLQITVAKPFWMTWTFRIIALFFIVLSIYIYIKRRIESERREQVVLEMKIKARTEELELKTQKIEEQKAKIEEQKTKIEKQKKRVERQKKQSDSILENVLPHSAVLDLKKQGKADARSFDKVSVMFTDFVGFTTISDNMDAQQLVAVLDKYFKAFDEIIGEHDLEKIKTIGDAYMCAGGVPVKNKTNPIDTILAGLKIKEFVLQQQLNARKSGDIEWSVRIGINTGPVSAGIIGSKRFAYDVWGKTVNHAQRMEKLCQPGRLAITGDTFLAVEPFFECSFAGIVESKSKGKIDMYYVDSIKSELSIQGKGISPNAEFYKLVDLHLTSAIKYIESEREIMSLLRQKLSPTLYYHSLQHTKDVTRQVERIAIQEGITNKDLFLLKSAASYHDAGFIEQYEKNEPIGARMAKEALGEFGYTEKDIERIEALIFATTVPHDPKNKLEEIICDADLDYLGREDFHEISDKLRLELRKHNKIKSDRAWDEQQVKFFKMHRYFTKTALDTRQAKKEKHLKEIELRLEEDKYVD
ncbi:MAG: adenylate/guanylate cyclase domain-containing protein [Lishizhenia sp.]